MSKKYEVYFEYKGYGFVTIEANNKEEAVNLVFNLDTEKVRENINQSKHDVIDIIESKK